MASRSINKVILIGNLTRDPELKYTPTGTAVCSFGVATNRSWSTATGELKEDVQFHRIVAWQKLAELCSKILAKGRKIYLEGRLTYRTYMGKDNIQRSITEIILDDFVVCDDRRKTEDVAAVTDTHPDEIVASKAESKTPPKKKEPEVETADLNDEKVDPDDIPF